MIKGFQLSVMTGSKVWPYKWKVEVEEECQRKGGLSILEGSSTWLMQSLRIMGSVRKSDNELGAKNKKREGNKDLWGHANYLDYLFIYSSPKDMFIDFERNRERNIVVRETVISCLLISLQLKCMIDFLAKVVFFRMNEN